ncbi:MAG TPA: TetR/AcrR family transcriptional regulator [Acidimicrobiales bacterium]|nr:TetR/AcrR family transcriptional regulator [Acidimicrobiales bacterium]
MTLSRQENPRNTTGRTNQKARTRTALLHAAAELVRDGRPPSMPEAADRALVSVATAYRYFSSAEDLWWEASNEAFGEQATIAQAQRRVEAAGSDPQARLEALIRSVGFAMLDDQVPYRRITKSALEQWFRQADTTPGERVPIRQGRRNQHVRAVLTPLEGRLARKDLDRIAHALGLIVGSEAMISLTDAVGLEVPAAKKTLLDAARWLLAGALAEMPDTSSQTKRPDGSGKPASTRSSRIVVQKPPSTPQP